MGASIPIHTIPGKPADYGILLYVAAVVCLLLPSTLYPQTGKDSHLSEENFRRSTTFLASDSLEGRGTGTRGEASAAEYLARMLREYNIQPAGSNGTFFQSVPMHGSTPMPGCRFNVRLQTGEKLLSLREDYVLFKTGAGTFIPSPLPLVFAGYGIAAQEYGYNDYLDVDVNNAIAVVLEGEPQSANPDYFNGTLPTPYSYPEMKQRIAFSRGARGCIVLPNPRMHPVGHSWQSAVQDFLFEHITLLYGVQEIFGAYISPETARLLFEGGSVSYSDILRADTTGAMRSFPMNAFASFQGRFAERDFVSRNVAGIIPGADEDLQDSFVLLSAHYDHLGIGPAVMGDSIYNGLADNAMGVSALLELARVLACCVDHRRSILVLFVTGEEKGLLGSRYYCDNPLAPLYKTIANINIDGIAMFDRFRNVVAVGGEYSTLIGHLAASAEAAGLEVSPMPPEFAGSDAFERSDQVAFAAAGIPSILVMDGMQGEKLTSSQMLSLFASWSSNVYHSPFDDLSQPVHFPAVMQHLSLLKALAIRLANTSEPPEWNSGTPFRGARLQTIHERR